MSLTIEFLRLLLVSCAFRRAVLNAIRWRMQTEGAHLVWASDPYYPGKHMLTAFKHGQIAKQVTGCSSLEQALSATFWRYVP